MKIEPQEGDEPKFLCIKKNPVKLQLPSQLIADDDGSQRYLARGAKYSGDRPVDNDLTALCSTEYVVRGKGQYQSVVRPIACQR